MSTQINSTISNTSSGSQKNMFTRLLLLTIFLTTPAMAQDKAASASEKAAMKESTSTVRVYQQRPLMRKNRTELTPAIGMGLNDAVYVHLKAGLTTRYHIDEAFSVGATYFKYRRYTTEEEPNLTQNYGVFPMRIVRDYYAGADVAWNPFYGKGLLLEAAIIPMDAYLVAGSGIMRTFEMGHEGSNRFSWNIGAGARLGINGWCAVQFELRDYMYFEELGDQSSLMQDVAIHLGVSFFLPLDYEYRYPK